MKPTSRPRQSALFWCDLNKLNCSPGEGEKKLGAEKREKEGVGEGGRGTLSRGDDDLGSRHERLLPPLRPFPPRRQFSSSTSHQESPPSFPSPSLDSSKRDRRSVGGPLFAAAVRSPRRKNGAGRDDGRGTGKLAFARVRYTVKVMWWEVKRRRRKRKQKENWCIVHLLSPLPSLALHKAPPPPILPFPPINRKEGGREAWGKREERKRKETAKTKSSEEESRITCVQ